MEDEPSDAEGSAASASAARTLADVHMDDEDSDVRIVVSDRLIGHWAKAAKQIVVVEFALKSVLLFSAFWWTESNH